MGDRIRIDSKVRQMILFERSKKRSSAVANLPSVVMAVNQRVASNGGDASTRHVRVATGSTNGGRWW